MTMKEQQDDPQKKAFELLDALAMASMVKLKTGVKIPLTPYATAKKIAIEFANEMSITHAEMRNYWQEVKRELGQM